ncbi:hypothetical protein AMTRI_Chr01g110870 [Amborella trichopoda]
MENIENRPRFSSCRGVAFEISPPRASPFSIREPQPEAEGRWAWLANRSKVLSIPSASASFRRSVSCASSHFCDVEVDEEVNDENQEDGETDIEKQLQKTPPVAPVEATPVSTGEKKNKGRFYSRISIMLLDQGLFTVYKRLYALCITLNCVALVLAATGRFSYARGHATAFAIGNVLVTVLCRSEAFLRMVFWLAVKVLGHPFVPLHLKTATTSFLQCLGGVHSGCGVSAIAWLVYALVLTLQDRENTSSAIIGVASSILALLCLSALAAFPLVRHLHHNVFERTHRFTGWAALALLWAFVLLTASFDPISKSYDLQNGAVLVNKQEFWFTAATTILIILPWLTVRRVPVQVSTPSGHASLIKFDGGVKPGILGRISRAPLSEWHAFGIISDNGKTHMMLAGAVGDFTKGLVTHPPRHLWVRSLHFAGLPYLVNMYQKVLLVATGSGICVFLSHMLQQCAAEVYVVWVAKAVEQNFGEEIVKMVRGYPKEKVILHDTATMGRPNVGELSVKAAKKWGVEAVVVTSNPEGSRDVVNACKAAGLPAFGPIWDS